MKPIKWWAINFIPLCIFALVLLPVWAWGWWVTRNDDLEYCYLHNIKFSRRDGCESCGFNEKLKKGA